MVVRGLATISAYGRFIADGIVADVAAWRLLRRGMKLFARQSRPARGDFDVTGPLDQ